MRDHLGLVERETLTVAMAAFTHAARKDGEWSIAISSEGRDHSAADTMRPDRVSWSVRNLVVVQAACLLPTSRLRW